jgi:hypothetical protein
MCETLDAGEQARKAAESAFDSDKLRRTLEKIPRNNTGAVSINSGLFFLLNR